MKRKNGKESKGIIEKSSSRSVEQFFFPNQEIDVC